MRRRFGKIINQLAKNDDKIVLLVGDIGYGIFDDFRKEVEGQPKLKKIDLSNGRSWEPKDDFDYLYFDQKSYKLGSL